MHSSEPFRVVQRRAESCKCERAGEQKYAIGRLTWTDGGSVILRFFAEETGSWELGAGDFLWGVCLRAAPGSARIQDHHCRCSELKLFHIPIRRDRAGNISCGAVLACDGF